MAQSSFPFENVDTSETQFSQMFRNFAAGVNGTPSGTELKVTAGTGLQVNVAAGQAMVRGHYYISTASEALTIGAADPTNPRIDSIVLTLDPTANSITLAVVAGTPASSPVAPTLTQTDAGTYQYQLATVAVAAAAGSVGTITDTRNFFGSRFGIWSTAGRPSAPFTGQAGYNSTTAAPEYYNGTSWASFTGATADKGATGYNPTWTTGNYRRNLPDNTTTAGSSISANTTQYSPIYFESAATLDRVSVIVSTGGGISTSVYLYSDVDGKPAARGSSLGNIATGTTGVKTLTVSVSVSAGLYWVGLGPDTNGPATFLSVSSNAYMENTDFVSSGTTVAASYSDTSRNPVTATPVLSSRLPAAVWVRKA